MPARTSRRRRTIAVALAASLIAAPTVSTGQSQSQVQYTYDAAGNLIGLARSAVGASPDLTVSNLTVGMVTVNGNGSFNIPVSFQVNNIGTAVAGATWYDRVYLSSNGLLHDSDQVFANFNTRSVPLAAGTSYSFSTTVTTSTSTPAGNYFVVVKADGGAAASGQYSPIGPNHVAELNEANNVHAAPVTLSGMPKPDLRLTDLTLGTLASNQDGTYNVPVSYTVTNIGTAAISTTFFDRAYLSSTPVLHDNDLVLSGFVAHPSLGIGASYAANYTFVLPSSVGPGSYYVFVKTDGGTAASGQYSPTGANAIAEYDEANNQQSGALVIPTRPDLGVSAASVGAMVANQDGSIAISGTVTVTNSGGLAAQPSWWDLAYLSADGVLENADVNLTGYRNNTAALVPGASYTVPVTYIAPATVASGNYTLFIKADGRGNAVGQGTNADNGKLVEANEANNALGIAVTIPARPDLTVSNASVGTLVANQDGSVAISGTVTVTNSGGLAAQPSWFDLAYLSTDSVLDNADVNLTGYRNNTAALAPGASYTVPFTYVAPATVTSGNYTLFLKADGRGNAVGQGTNTDNGKLVEASEANNAQGIALTIPARPDLVASNVAVGTIVKNANNSKSIPVTFTVTNAGGLATQPTWYDLAYLSIDGVLDNADVNLSGYRTNSAALAPGGSYTATVTFTTSTSTAAGSYTLFMKTDGRGAAISQGTNTDNGKVVESNELNNVMAIPVVLP